MMYSLYLLETGIMIPLFATQSFTVYTGVLYAALSPLDTCKFILFSHNWWCDPMLFKLSIAEFLIFRCCCGGQTNLSLLASRKLTSRRWMEQARTNRYQFECLIVPSRRVFDDVSNKFTSLLKKYSGLRQNTKVDGVYNSEIG